MMWLHLLMRELGSVDWLNFDNDDNGKLFCVRAPENGDAGTASITISLAG